MLVEWLYRTTLEVSLLIGFVLLIRPIVRRTLGARAAYWLWCLPLLRAVLPDRPARPELVIESVSFGTGDFDVFPAAASWSVPGDFSWEPIWIIGLASWLIIRLFAWIRFRRTLDAHSFPIDLPAGMLALTRYAANTHRVQFLACDLPGTPFVTGLINPRICLPRNFGKHYTAAQQAWIIQHELTHIARYDLWMQFAWEVLRAAFWFNPVVHIAARAVRDDQELACDQSIVSHCDVTSRIEYGKTLIANTNANASAYPSSIPFFGKNKERIAMIGRHKASGIRNGIGIALCAVLGACALTSAPPSSSPAPGAPRSPATEPAPGTAAAAPTATEAGAAPGVAPPATGRGNFDTHITLSFDSIELRYTLQLLATVSGTNIVIADTVPNALVTFRAEDVPIRYLISNLASCVGAEVDYVSDNLVRVGPASSGTATSACVDIVVSEQDG